MVFFFIPYSLIFFIVLGLLGQFWDNIETIGNVLIVLSILADFLVLCFFAEGCTSSRKEKIPRQDLIFMLIMELFNALIVSAGIAYAFREVESLFYDGSLGFLIGPIRVVTIVGILLISKAITGCFFSNREDLSKAKCFIGQIVISIITALGVVFLNDIIC